SGKYRAGISGRDNALARSAPGGQWTARFSHCAGTLRRGGRRSGERAAGRRDAHLYQPAHGCSPRLLLFCEPRARGEDGMIATAVVEVRTQGNGQVLDITHLVVDEVSQSGIRGGIVTVFCPGATGAVTTIEFEEGAVRDFNRLFDEIA